MHAAWRVCKSVLSRSRAMRKLSSYTLELVWQFHIPPSTPRAMVNENQNWRWCDSPGNCCEWIEPFGSRRNPRCSLQRSRELSSSDGRDSLSLARVQDIRDGLVNRPAGVPLPAQLRPLLTRAYMWKLAIHPSRSQLQSEVVRDPRRGRTNDYGSRTKLNESPSDE
jgi:hypothetical protein